MIIGLTSTARLRGCSKIHYELKPCYEHCERKGNTENAKVNIRQQ